MLAVIWWMYDGYAWLTNAIATDLLRFRLLLLGGMGGFLVIALAIPTAYGVNGLAFGIGYVVVVLLHAGMYAKGTSVSEVTAILRIVPFNLTAAVMVLVGGIAGGRRSRTSSGCSRRFCCGSRRGSRARRASSSRRGTSSSATASSIIVALGESIVVIGAGATGRPLDVGIVLVALLALALSACLWWLYFRDEEAVEQAMTDATPTRRARLALVAFGYWHYGLVLGVVGVAAGTEEGDRRSVRSARRVDRPRSSPSASRCSSPARRGSWLTLGLGVEPCATRSPPRSRSRRFPSARSGPPRRSSLR